MRRYRVYVIRLKNSVWKRSRKYREANPQYEEGRPHVYVGSTGRAPEQRFKRHLSGGRGSSALVRRFGKRLFTSEYEDLPTFPDRPSAERLEAEKALELKARGWGVWYNADPVDPAAESKAGTGGTRSLSRAKLRRYATTVLEFGDPVLEVDLRRPPSTIDLLRLREAAGASEFTVITAENPRGSARPPSENQEASDVLRRILEKAGLSFVPAVGRDPEDTHREASWAVHGPLEPALSLAREFQQDAVFRYDGERFLLVDTMSGEEYPLPLEEGGP